MKQFVEGEDRNQVTLLPECLDDYLGTVPDRAGPGSAAVGGGRCRVGRPEPAMGTVGTARTGLRIRLTHRLLARTSSEPCGLVAG
jgi:hypothetical protein